MEKREYKVMWNYYLGISKVPTIWDEEIEQLHLSKVIRKIYEVIDNEFNEVWYLIRTTSEKSYIVKSKCGRIYAKDIMKKYSNYYRFNKVNTEIIKLFSKGYFPIVFKVPEKEFINYYDESKNKNCIFLNNYYCYSKDLYKAVRVSRNKVEFEIFNLETDAVFWLSDFSITKEDILKNDIRPLDLMERVYEYEKEKG